MSKKNAQVKPEKSKKVKSADVEVKEVSESPVQSISKDGVAIFKEGMLPRQRREAEKIKPEAEPAEVEE